MSVVYCWQSLKLNLDKTEFMKMWSNVIRSLQIARCTYSPYICKVRHNYVRYLGLSFDLPFIQRLQNSSFYHIRNLKALTHRKYSSRLLKTRPSWQVLEYWRQADSTTTACHTGNTFVDLASWAIAAILVVTVYIRPPSECSDAILRHYDRVAVHATPQWPSTMAKTGHD